jgi:hypothetical protein
MRSDVILIYYGREGRVLTEEAERGMNEIFPTS